MNIRIFKSEHELDAYGADFIASRVKENPASVLGLATGSSPIGIYKQFIALAKEKKLSFKEVQTFNLDEYIGLSPSHPQSYHYYMQMHLFKHIDIDEAKIHIPKGDHPDPEQACTEYDQLLEQIQIDVQILGIGQNGHIGFNEPAQELISGTHIVELDESTRKANARFFESIDQVPTHAITMGVGSILKAREILLIVKGASKAEAVHKALNGPITTSCPASLLQTHPNLTVLLDEDARRLLK